MRDCCEQNTAMGELRRGLVFFGSCFSKACCGRSAKAAVAIQQWLGAADGALWSGCTGRWCGLGEIVL